MKRLAILLPLLALVAMPAFAQDPATPVFSCRADIGESGSFPVVRDWRLRYGPDEATADGVPKWTIELVKGSDPCNRLLPNGWHGLQPCEVAPALVATNETRVLPVRGGPWLLRLSLDGVGVDEDGAVRGRAAMELFPRFAAPVVAASGSALSLRPGPGGGPPELFLLRAGTEIPIGTAEHFAGEWDEDAWIDAVAFTNVLGADGFAITTSVGLHCATSYFAEKDDGLYGLASSWRLDDAFLDPLSCGRMDFAVDLDGDGVRELVCGVEQWAHDCAWPRKFWPHIHIFRLADGHVEECGDMMPLLDEPDRLAKKRYAESQWSPTDGKIFVRFVTEDGEQRVFSVAPDLTRLSFTRTDCDWTLSVRNGNAGERPALRLVRGGESIDWLPPERLAAWVAGTGGKFAVSPFRGILGFDGFRVDALSGTTGSRLTRYLAVKGDDLVPVADSFGDPGDEDHAVDLDGDGVDELVCDVTWEMGGHPRVHLFRRVDGVSMLCDDPTPLLPEPASSLAWAGLLRERYDPKTKTIRIRYLPERRAQESPGNIGEEMYEEVACPILLERLSWRPFIDASTESESHAESTERAEP